MCGITYITSCKDLLVCIYIIVVSFISQRVDFVRNTPKLPKQKPPLSRRFFMLYLDYLKLTEPRIRESLTISTGVLEVLPMAEISLIIKLMVLLVATSLVSTKTLT